jgi:hypothetical protein
VIAITGTLPRSEEFYAPSVAAVGRRIFGGFRNSTAYSGTSIGDSGVSEKAGEIGQSAIMPSGDVGAWQLNADGKAIF